MDENRLKELHETFLYPVVRIFSKKAAGSGTTIYCQEDPKNKDEYITLVLTNHHVIEDLISQKQDWDSLLKRKIEKEFIEKAKVEYFSYVRMSKVDSSNRYDADVIAYDKYHDLAVLRINSPLKRGYVAQIIPEDEIKNLRLFMEVVASGCSMAHEPFCTYGQLTFLNELIDQKEYVMYNAGSYFGSSGGALFLRETGWLIGVPSRLTGIQLGFGIDMVTHMGFAAHPKRLYEFFREQELHFIFDPEDDYYSAMERRKNKEKESLMGLKAEFLRQETTRKESRSGGSILDSD